MYVLDIAQNHPIRHPRRVPSIEKMRQMLGLEAQVPLDDGLERMIERFRQSVR